MRFTAISYERLGERANSATSGAKSKERRANSRGQRSEIGDQEAEGRGCTQRPAKRSILYTRSRAGLAAVAGQLRMAFQESFDSRSKRKEFRALITGVKVIDLSSMEVATQRKPSLPPPNSPSLSS